MHFNKYIFVYNRNKVVFFLDINATATVKPNKFANGTDYTPSPNRMLWKKVNYLVSLRYLIFITSFF